MLGFSPIRGRRREPIGFAAPRFGGEETGRIAPKPHTGHARGHSEDGGEGEGARKYDMATTAATSHSKLSLPLIGWY